MQVGKTVNFIVLVFFILEIINKGIAYQVKKIDNADFWVQRVNLLLHNQ